MIYVKSVLAGLVALIVVAILFIGLLAVGLIVYNNIHPRQGEGSIGWDPISLYRTNHAVVLVPVLIFLAGFIWEYRRLAE